MFAVLRKGVVQKAQCVAGKDCVVKKDPTASIPLSRAMREIQHPKIDGPRLEMFPIQNVVNLTAFVAVKALPVL